jgi:hypothetical protein
MFLESRNGRTSIFLNIDSAACWRTFILPLHDVFTDFRITVAVAALDWNVLHKVFPIPIQALCFFLGIP